MKMRLICQECGASADYLGADTAEPRPQWRALCQHDYDRSEVWGKYWISVDDLRSRDLAWWLCHIEGKTWGAASDFRSLVAAMVGYDTDPRVVRESS